MDGFSWRGVPIVNTPEDAFSFFMGCEMENLVVGNSAPDELALNEKDKFYLGCVPPLPTG